MRTPAGRECRYYYGDFHRGRNVQECRLIRRNPDSLPWKPELCETCPLPDILLANACPHMILDARVVKRFFGLKQRVEVSGWCKEHFLEVEHPHVGCGHCHEYRDIPPIHGIFEAPDE